MNDPSDQSDYILDRFDAWLKEAPVVPDKGFLAAVRSRLEQPSGDLEAAIDELLQPDPSLKDPHMAAKVRQRMARSHSSRNSSQWFRWLTPLAAAATLTLAFISFQMQAPGPMAPVALNSGPGPVAAPSVEPDTDLTEIFALAANLHGPADVSSLQSVDNLAYLFE
jgi:hypothetical protein